MFNSVLRLEGGKEDGKAEYVLFGWIGDMMP